MRTIISGNSSSVQLQSELQTQPIEEREKIVKSISSVRITAEHSLAMKTELQLPWNKLRELRRQVFNTFKPHAYVYVHTRRYPITILLYINIGG